MQNVKLQFEKKNNDYRIREAFKTLRSNIEFCGGDVKVIAVTSCTPNEGKSSVAMEMARAFAEAGSKTMLIDADMRKSVLVGRYKTGAVRKGLTHCLIGKANYLEVMCETNVPNLYVTFSGPVPPNPSELLGGEKFRSILNVLRSSFDYVIVDTPRLAVSLMRLLLQRAVMVQCLSSRAMPSATALPRRSRNSSIRLEAVSLV